MSQLFQQSLSGLIKALRANKHGEQRVIDTALQEIKQEVTSKDWDVKAAAILKLTYLEMLGYPTLLSHSFPVIECMAAQKYHIKQIGYLAAAQSFGESTQVILLTHNLIKKDLQASSHPSTVILALTSLPTLLSASPDLAEDILPDLLRMLSHSKAQVRRIGTLVVGKIWASLHSISFEFSHVEKLRAGLNDQDVSVVSANVNVMLELGRSRHEALPSLLGLAPELFDLLTNSSNNWMLIKIVKLDASQFALLTPIEPRLVRKLLPPLSNLISTTPAFSLLYECIQTVIVGGMLSTNSSASEANTLANTCIEKLSAFLSDADQNLRYIALKGLTRLMATHSHLLTRHYEEILACIDEEDYTIRMSALELIEKLTDRSNCREVVRRLLAQLSPSNGVNAQGGSTVQADAGGRSAAAALRAISSNYDKTSPSAMADVSANTSTSPSHANAISDYRYRLLILIVNLTSRSSEDGSQLYVNISNFEWYIDTLITLSYYSVSILPASPASRALGTKASSQHLPSRITECILDVCSRAPSIRAFATKRMTALLGDGGFLQGDILLAAGFIVSEYADVSQAKDSTQLLLSTSLRLGENAHALTSGSGSLASLALCAVKCLAKWLYTLRDTWQDSYMAGLETELKELECTFANIEGNGVDYSTFIKLVREGLAGPRAPQNINDIADVPTNIHVPISAGLGSPEATQAEDELSHNPFATVTSQSAPIAQETMEQPPEASGTRVVDPEGPPLALSLLHDLLFGYELRALAANAQAAVEVPDSLDLNAWIGPNLGSVPILSDDEENLPKKNDVDEYGRPKNMPASSSNGRNLDPQASKDGQRRKKKGRRTDKDEGVLHDGEDVDAIPIVKLDLGDDAESAVDRVDSKAKRKKEKSKEVVVARRPRTPSPPPVILSAGGDMPLSRAAKAPSPVPPPTFRMEADAPLQGSNDELTAAAAQTVQVIKVKKKRTKDKDVNSTKKDKERKKPVADTANLVQL